jgi:hypothetical protein
MSAKNDFLTNAIEQMSSELVSLHPKFFQTEIECTILTALKVYYHKASS